MNKPVYLIDTNVFIRFESGDIYDKECFPEVFDLFLKLKEGYPGWPKGRGILPRITLEIKTILRLQVKYFNESIS